MKTPRFPEKKVVTDIYCYIYFSPTHALHFTFVRLSLLCAFFYLYFWTNPFHYSLSSFLPPSFRVYLSCPLSFCLTPATPLYLPRTNPLALAPTTYCYIRPRPLSKRFRYPQPARR